MLKFIQNNREITALLAVVLLFVLPGFLDRQYLSVQTLTMVYSSAQILILLAMGATLVMLMRKVVSAMISWIILSRAREKYGAASVVVDEQSWLSSGVKKSPY
ncbi:TPA: ABC transporter permease [Shigella sonnei]|nr:ABC transporter permease [Shigella sonnei]